MSKHAASVGNSLCIDVPQVAVPHLDQYFGVWAVEEDRFQALAQRVGLMDLNAHVETEGPKAAANNLSFDVPIVEGGIAVIDLYGPLMKRVSSLSGGTSTVRARRLLRMAMEDERVTGVLLRIDSPGGTVAGTHALAADVALLAERKPVHAFVEDMAASAAYWVATAADRMSVEPMAMVGSIGTFFVIADLSGAAAAEGVKVHVIRPDGATFKGAGAPGTAITDEHLVEWKRLVTELNDHFIHAVVAGRGMAIAKVRELADGRVHVGASAVKLGLADAVQTFDEAMADLRSAIGGKNNSSRGRAATAVNGDQLMSGQGNESAAQAANTADAGATQTPSGPVAATVAQIRAAFPDASSDFIVGCAEKDLTVEQCGKARMAELQVENKKLREDADTAKASKDTPGVEGVGCAGGSGGAEVTGDPIEQWNAAVKEKVDGGMSKQKAFRAVARDQPELRQAFVSAHNVKHGRTVGGR